MGLTELGVLLALEEKLLRADVLREDEGDEEHQNDLLEHVEELLYQQPHPIKTLIHK